MGVNPQVNSAIAAWLSIAMLAAIHAPCRSACGAKPRAFDEQRAAALGIRKLEGRHVTMYTDVPAMAAVDELPRVFDAAVPVWAEFFGTEAAADWQPRVCLIRDRGKFQACGLLKADVPTFRNGFTYGQELFCMEQESDYYRRHLVLHEGTHAYTLMASGGATGPLWYFEGLAELLGTHRWRDGKLAMGVIPANREEAPLWGRVKIVQDEMKAGRPMSLVKIMGYPVRAHHQNETYGWCWAAAHFFDHHPAYRGPFRQMTKHLALPDRDFNSAFYKQVSKRWGLMGAEWQHFVTSMDYGFDVAREAIPESSVAKPAQGRVEVQAGQGWQPTGLWLRSGVKYDVSATGRFQVADKPKPWISEPNGVTLRYHRGKPVGVLLAAVHDPSKPPKGLCQLCKPLEIGVGATIAPVQSGMLYLRVNESPRLLADDQGAIAVTVQPKAAP